MEKLGWDVLQAGVLNKKLLPSSCKERQARSHGQLVGILNDGLERL